MPEKFSGNEGEQFLNKKYPDLQKSPEVESASRRKEVRTGKKPKDKNEKVGAHLERLEEIFNTDDESKKEFRINFLKEKLRDKFVMKEIPESYFKNQQRIAREQGHGDIEINDQLQEETKTTIIADQKQSLDNWINYLGSRDATYPNWLKYWAFRSITQLSQYDKEAHEFKKRSKSTTAPFPDINREALAYVLDAVEKKQKGQSQEITDEAWEKLLKTQNFAKLYAHAIEKITPASEEEKENIQGQWVKYDQGSDPKPLYESLQGHGTGWCTAGESTAEAQLKLGDFYVYYTKNQQGDYKIPRVAIRMQEGEIAEVRGINVEQNLESVMTDITKEKMQTLPGGERYEKKVSDMKRLTEINGKFISTKDLYESLKKPVEVVSSKERNKIRDKIEEIELKNRAVELTKEELKFLYEIDVPIEGFGYQKDPRIEDITNTRDKRSDIALATGCKPEEISLTKEEALQGNIKYHYGYLDLRGLTSAEGLKLPEIVGRGLDLEGLTSAKGLKLPENVGGYLYLRGLTSAEGLKLPESVGGNLDLRGLTSAEGLKLPESVGGYLNLRGLTSAEGLKLPERVGGGLDLRGLISTEKENLRKQYPNLKIE